MKDEGTPLALPGLLLRNAIAKGLGLRYNSSGEGRRW